MAGPNDKTILVVEDEPDVQSFLAATLEDAGFRVTTASNGLDAYNRVKESRPDLITLDLVMPRQSGLLFYKRLRKNAKLASIPVIVVTAHARDDLGEKDFEDLMGGGELPAPHGFLQKPVQPAELVRQIATALNVELGAEVELMARGDIMDKLRDADLDTLRQVQELLTRK